MFGFEDRVYVEQANVLSLDADRYKESSFDSVTALECAFHFNTREVCVCVCVCVSVCVCVCVCVAWCVSM